MRGIQIEQKITNRQDSSLGLYFKDVSKQILISPDEEVILAKEIKKGNQQAIDKLILANLRFVISVAKQYQNKGLSLVDLIQEGNIGLIKAAKAFDETRGFKFISYAVWWIRQSITKALSNQCRTVRLPANQVGYASKLNQIIAKFEQLHGRKPSEEELLDCSDLSKEQIFSSLVMNPKFSYLDNPLGDENSGCLLDLLPNENVENPDNNTVQEGNSMKLDKILSKLSYRDRDIIKMYFGIGMSPMQFEEIANRFGLSIERVRQLYLDIIEYLKDNYKEELRELL
jgi:RNA polymerase primary sigma factor